MNGTGVAAVQGIAPSNLEETPQSLFDPLWVFHLSPTGRFHNQ
jgi:hypothetical protein